MPEGLLYLDIDSPGAPGAATASAGCRVAVSFSARLAAKNGWTFASADEEAPFEWTLGDEQSNVLRGLDLGVVGMRVGGVRRLVVPPRLGYRDEHTEPVPVEFWQRRRLYSTVFNGTRLANGEGDTLATTVWDVRLLRVRC